MSGKSPVRVRESDRQHIVPVKQSLVEGQDSLLGDAEKCFVVLSFHTIIVKGCRAITEVKTTISRLERIAFRNKYELFLLKFFISVLLTITSVFARQQRSGIRVMIPRLQVHTDL